MENNKKNGEEEEDGEVEEDKTCLYLLNNKNLSGAESYRGWQPEHYSSRRLRLINFLSRVEYAPTALRQYYIVAPACPFE